MATDGDVDGDLDAVVDARGFLCPVPLLRLKRQARGTPPGRRVVLLATDPAAPLDVAAWCNIEGHGFLGHRDAGSGAIEIVVRIGAAGPFGGGTPVL